jgi:signal transduction histidine kinase
MGSENGSASEFTLPTPPEESSPRQVEDYLGRVFDKIESSLMSQDYETASELFSPLEDWYENREAALQRDLSQNLRARYYLMRARVRLHEKRVVESLEAAETARLLSATDRDAALHADIHRTLGNIFMVMRDYGRALSYFEETLDLAGNLDDDRLKAFTLNSIAIAYWRMKQWKEAGNYLRQARAAHQDDPRTKAMIDNNIGVALLEQGKFERAESLFRETLAFQKKAENKYATALLQSNLGDLYQRKGQPQRALTYLETSMEIPARGRNLSVFTRSLRHKARVFIDLGHHQRAVEACQQSLAYARELQDRAEMMDSYEALIDVHESAGDFKAALAAFRQRSDLKEEILSDQTRLQSTQFKVRYESSEKERRMRELEQEKKIQEIQRNAVIAILLLLLVIISILVFRGRRNYRANRQIREQKEEIEKSHASLQEAYTRLEEVNREKDEILGIAAHDLRNPIGAIRQIALMLQEDNEIESAEERKSMSGDILHSADTVLDILANLLDLNRLEQSGVSINWETLPAHDVIEAVLHHYHKEADRKKQALAYLPPAEEIPLHADRLLLQQVIGNLVSNAIKYSPPGSSIRIELSTTEDGGKALFKVHDEGPGLTKEDQRRLFHKFARLSPRPTGGETSTGLGLSIVHKLVRMMRGRVWCESVLGHGSTFGVEIPCGTMEETS